MATFLGIDYATLWFFVIGGLFSGYAILDGFDLGAGAWHLFFRKEKSRRIALNSIGPVWDGNEVWLVIGGGALFAGFPVVYASVLSGMYIPFMLFLLFLILRAVAIEFRSKEPMAWWRTTWDVTYSVSSAMLALLLGVVLGNVLKGMPLGPGYEMQGSWLQFLNPYALLIGLTTLALFMMHGGLYLLMKTEGRLFEKVNMLVWRSILFFVLMFVCSSIYTFVDVPHMADRYISHPVFLGIPAAALLSIANVPRLVSKRHYRSAFVFSSLTLALLLLLVAIELYPVIIRSSIDPAFNLTVANASASEKSLGIMLLFAAVGAPLVLSYTAFVFWTFRGKVQLDDMSY